MRAHYNDNASADRNRLTSALMDAKRDRASALIYLCAFFRTHLYK